MIDELSAKEAYGIWADRTGKTTPFEHLPVAEMEAWDAVLQGLGFYDDISKEDSGECADCGHEMVCMPCIAKGLYNLTCPECEGRFNLTEEQRKDLLKLTTCEDCTADLAEGSSAPPAEPQAMAAAASQTYCDGGIGL